MKTNELCHRCRARVGEGVEDGASALLRRYLVIGGGNLPMQNRYNTNFKVRHVS